MGARPSTPRTVQLDNDIPVGVIDVSDDVVLRLKGLHTEGHFHFSKQNFHFNLNHILIFLMYCIWFM